MATNLKNSSDISMSSFGTETQFSDTSINASDMNEQSGGGLFSFLFNNDYDITDLIFDSYKDKKYDVAQYIVKLSLTKGYSLDFTKQDASGKTLLHHIVISISNNSSNKELLLSVLQSQCTKKSINIQDNDGNTVAHHALYLDLEDVVNLLVDFGVDLSLKNKKGLNIKMSQVPQEKETDNLMFDKPENNIFVKLPQNSFNKTSSDNKIKNIIQSFRNSDLDTIGFNKNDLSSFSSDTPRLRESNSFGPHDSDDILRLILNEFGNKRGGLSGGATNKTADKTINGKRKIVTYSEMSVNTDTNTSYSETSSLSESDCDQLNDSDLRDLSELAKKIKSKSKKKTKSGQTKHELSRAFDNKATEAHVESVEKIKKNVKGISDVEARAYKAIIWDMIKSEYPTMENYDQSMELLKKSSDPAFLKTITKDDVNKMIEIIENKRKQRESSASSTPVKKNKKNKQLSSDSGWLSSLSTISSSDIEIN